jgi:hypothetical protein
VHKVGNKVEYLYPLAVFNEIGRFRLSLAIDLGNLRTLLAVVPTHDLGTVFCPAYNQSDKGKVYATPIQG